MRRRISTTIIFTCIMLLLSGCGAQDNPDQSAVGGSGWKFLSGNVSNKLTSSISVEGIWIVKMNLELDPEIIDLENISDESWEIQGSDYEMVKFTKPEKDDSGAFRSLLMILGTNNMEALNIKGSRPTGSCLGNGSRRTCGSRRLNRCSKRPQ